jgi:hypothetical protein
MTTKVLKSNALEDQLELLSSMVVNLASKLAFMYGGRSFEKNSRTLLCFNFKYFFPYLVGPQTGVSVL